MAEKRDVKPDPEGSPQNGHAADELHRIRELLTRVHKRIPRQSLADELTRGRILNIKRELCERPVLEMAGPVRTQMAGHLEFTVEKAAEIKILSKKDPVPLYLLLRSNLVNRNSLVEHKQPIIAR